MTENRHDIASGRAAFYDLLIAVFEHLPSRNLLAKIRDGEFERLLAGYCGLGEQGLEAGLKLISSYRISLTDKPDDDVLTGLAVDRTRILRGTGHADMLPAYEGVYTKGAGLGDSVLEVRRFYRKAGIVPEETVTDAADYLCVELDFMKQLSLREEALRLEEAKLRDDATQSIVKNIAMQEEFLRLHLGNWVGKFCKAVENHASTDFYRGFALILDAYIRIERKWLQSLVRR
jgi:putative dimethyl sulfoxide reductase chaperone